MLKRPDRASVGPIVVALAAGLLASFDEASHSPVVFGTQGGDAFTFEKVIATSVSDPACDAVAFTSPTGTLIVRPEAGRAIAAISLGPGDNVVEAECRLAGVRRGAAAQQHWFVRLTAGPRARVQVTHGDSGIILDASLTRLAPTRAAPIVAHRWRARPGNPEPLAGLPMAGERIALPVPTTDGEYYVTLRVTDAAERVDESTVMIRVRRGKPETIELGEHPAWVDDAVVYGIVPTLFGGRGFAAVTARLDDLAALGVTTLWLSPITASPLQDFGYAVTDHFRLREALGTDAEFRALVRAAHLRRLRVIIDLVSNHLSDQHPYFRDAETHGRASPYFDFFARTANGEPMHYFEWRNLENLNYDNPEVQELIIEASRYWVRTFDVDGFRVDAAWGPNARAPGFWRRWREELKRIKPDLLLLGEASGRDQAKLGQGFDAGYDWTDQLGQWAWQHAFEDEPRTARRLRAAIGEPGTDAATAPVIFRFLDNNDTGARFITRYGASRTRVAAAMLLTLPGLPALYTGDEVGAAFEPYHESKPINWEDALGMRDWYRRLLALRHGLPALRSAELRWLDLAAGDQVLAYLRPAAHRGDDVVVLLNYGAKTVIVTLPMDAVRGLTSGHQVVDVLNNEQFTQDALAVVIPLPGYGVRILTAK
jgi:cyclomaltodextrinase / maltogenic alpha-amylase / neopullulanase